jgi:hypothetical protein
MKKAALQAHLRMLAEDRGDEARDVAFRRDYGPETYLPRFSGGFCAHSENRKRGRRWDKSVNCANAIRRGESKDANTREIRGKGTPHDL